MKMAKGKIKQFETLVKLLNKSSSFFNKITTELRDELYPIRADLQKIYNAVSAMCYTIDNRFLEKLNELTELSIVNQNDGTNQNEDIFNDTDLTEEDINDIVDALENVNQSKFIEYYTDKNGFRSGYKILPNDL